MLVIIQTGRRSITHLQDDDDSSIINIPLIINGDIYVEPHSHNNNNVTDSPSSIEIPASFIGGTIHEPQRRSTERRQLHEKLGPRQLLREEMETATDVSDGGYISGINFYENGDNQEVSNENNNTYRSLRIRIDVDEPFSTLSSSAITDATVDDDDDSNFSLEVVYRPPTYRIGRGEEYSQHEVGRSHVTYSQGIGGTRGSCLSPGSSGGLIYEPNDGRDYDGSVRGHSFDSDMLDTRLYNLPYHNNPVLDEVGNNNEYYFDSTDEDKLVSSVVARNKLSLTKFKKIVSTSIVGSESSKIDNLDSNNKPFSVKK